MKWTAILAAAALATFPALPVAHAQDSMSGDQLTPEASGGAEGSQETQIPADQSGQNAMGSDYGSEATGGTQETILPGEDQTAPDSEMEPGSGEGGASDSGLNEGTGAY